MVGNYEERWKFIERNQEFFDLALELEAKGFDVVSYFQDMIDDKLKPRRCYLQTDQAGKPG